MFVNCLTISIVFVNRSLAAVGMLANCLQYVTEMSLIFTWNCPNYTPTISAIFLAFLGKLCPNYAQTIPAIFLVFLGQPCLNYSQRDYDPNMPFAPTMSQLCPNYARVLPQPCPNYVLADYRDRLAEPSPLL